MSSSWSSLWSFVVVVVVVGGGGAGGLDVVVVVAGGGAPGVFFGVVVVVVVGASAGSVFVVVVGGGGGGSFVLGASGVAWPCVGPGCSVAGAWCIGVWCRLFGAASGNGSRTATVRSTCVAAARTWCGTSVGRSATAGVAVAAVASAATPPIVAPSDGVSGRRISSGAFESQASGPTRNRMRPSEMLTNARTSRGSNCDPEQRTSSARASAGVAASL